MKRLFFWGGALALLAAVARLSLPARLLDARVTSVVPGHPAYANVVLRYGSGAIPTCVIVDVAERDGSGGSATVEGRDMFLEVPVVGDVRAGCQVTTTATYQVFGWPYTVVVRMFPASSEQA